MTFALHQVHAVETKGLNADQSLSGGGGRAFDLVDEERGGGALAILDIYGSCESNVSDGTLRELR